MCLKNKNKNNKNNYKPAMLTKKNRNFCHDVAVTKMLHTNLLHDYLINTLFNIKVHLH